MLASLPEVLAEVRAGEEKLLLALDATGGNVPALELILSSLEIDAICRESAAYMLALAEAGSRPLRDRPDPSVDPFHALSSTCDHLLRARQLLGESAAGMDDDEIITLMKDLQENLRVITRSPEREQERTLVTIPIVVEMLLELVRPRG